MVSLLRTGSILLALALVALAPTLGLSGCGFQLRGAYTLPFESLYLNVPETSLVGASLKRQLRASKSTRLADRADDAQATFLNTVELREPVILSFSGAGRVREKRLRYRYGYRVIDAKGRDLIAPGFVELFRDISYSDSEVLAKTQEENLLWQDMENDLVQQLLRRLSSAKLLPPPQAD